MKANWRYGLRVLGLFGSAGTQTGDMGTKHANTVDTRRIDSGHQLAAELGVDAVVLKRFVDEHPRPTAPIVLGWAFDRGELAAPPEALRDDVERWLGEVER